MGTLSTPAEWHANEAVWLAWPSHPEEWHDQLGPARVAVAGLARAIADIDPRTGQARGERVDLLVLDEAGERDARAHLGEIPVVIHRVPFGDIWLRDTGPIFSWRGRTLVAACFQWNGWGGKYLFEHDAEVAERIATRAGAVVERHEFILEGGAIDWDDDGTALTTRQCLLAGNRATDGCRPQVAEVERRLRRALGVTRVIWLERGLENDHTDGHVDTIARFVAPGRVVCMRAHDASDPNGAALDRVARDLRSARNASGQRLDVVEIPAPGRILDGDGQLLPASYVNFYLGNTTVVVPIYGVDHDRDALDTFESLFPGRRVVGVDARALLTGGGALHCISKQEPRRARADRAQRGG